MAENKKKIRKTPDLSKLDELAGAAQVLSQPKREKGTRKKNRPTSFVLGEIDHQRLKKITADVNEISSRKISEATIVKALLLQGSQTKTEKLFQLVKDAMF